MPSRYNPDQHHRRSIRLPGYDYASPGAYFITICCHQRQFLFGDIVNGQLQPTEAGEIAQRCWAEIPQHFPQARLDEFVIMPNHLHGILILGNGWWNQDFDQRRRRDPTDFAAQSPNDDTTPSPPHSSTGIAVQCPTGPSPNDAQSLNDEFPTGHPTPRGNTNPTPNPSPPHGSTGIALQCPNEQSPNRPSPNGQFLPPHEIHRRTFGKMTPGSIPAITRSFKSATTKQINLQQNTPGSPIWQRNYYENIVRDSDALENIRRYIRNNPSKWQRDRLSRSAH